MQDLGSGDWIGLAEAARICSEVLESSKSEEDVLKIGFLGYQNIASHLKIYTFSRQHITIKPHEWNGLKDILPNQELSSPQINPEQLWAFKACSPGDIFELHSDVLERLLLLRTMSSAHCAWSAVIRAASPAELPGWKHTPALKDERSEHWSAVFDGVIAPEIELAWDDLRVDRQELIVLLEESKQMPIPNNSGMGVPIKTADKEITVNERNTLLVIIAALCKQFNINHADRNAASKISGYIESLPASVSAATVRKKLDLIPDAVGRRMTDTSRK